MKKLLFAILLITGILISHMAINIKAQEGIAEFEYTVVALRGMKMSDKNQIRVMNEYAAQGWRLINVVSLGGGLVPYFYFEREIDY